MTANTLPATKLYAAFVREDMVAVCNAAGYSDPNLRHMAAYAAKEQGKSVTIRPITHAQFMAWQPNEAPEMVLPEAVRKCGKCLGTGTYEWEALLPQGGTVHREGPCWDCKGKGHQTQSDILRDNAYHDHEVAGLIASDIRQALTR